MRADSGKTVSVWMDTAELPRPPALEKDLTVDVCVVGAGIAGLTTAYRLSGEGRSVVVVDDGPLAGGETARTTAHLSNALDDRYGWIEQVHGEKGARLTAESHTAAIDAIERWTREEGIDCGFERLDGYLFNPPEEEEGVDLARERDAARRAGLADVEIVARAPLSLFDTGPALRFPRQGQFHPLLYLRGIAAAIERRGGRLAKAHAAKIEGGAHPSVETADGRVVRAGSVVVATNSPVNLRLAIHTKQAPYRTYVIGVRVPHGVAPRALLWDTLEPYHYLRSQPLGDGGDELLIVGGEDHKTGQEDPGERHSRLEGWARTRFPSMGDVIYRWSGQVMETVDGLAFIGASPDGVQNVYVATGDSGMGMTHGTIAGILIGDLVLGRENPWAEIYDPSRISLRAAANFAKENVNVALQYADYALPAEAEGPQEIPAGEGAVLVEGVKRIAAYRDPSGAVHRHSAVCVHLGCVVAWNPLEKSWDCPCHGSRFDPYGRVVNGPANRDLDPD
ncbi:MAG TPA: FAD-dependent oxidoreductase [Thermoanaerobaculia bacterium]|nr:FAD-dependent oxidoreductase [Thermoanaerobaculia bacterium]